MLTVREKEGAGIHSNSHQDVIQMEAVLDSLPEAVLAVDQAGGVTYYNRVASTLFGDLTLPLLPEEWPSRFGLFTEDGLAHYPTSQLPLLVVLGGAEHAAAEMILRPPGPQADLWISFSAQAMRRKDGVKEGALVVLREISYRKEVEFSREIHARRAEALFRVSRSIAEAGLELPLILDAVAYETCRSIGDGCIISLLVGEKSLKIASVHHVEPQIHSLLNRKMLAHEFTLKTDIASKVIMTGEPMLIPKVAKDQRGLFSRRQFMRLFDEIGLESVLIVPLKGQHNILGTIRLLRNRSGSPYTLEDQTFLLDIARRLSQAIENCYLFDSLREQIEERLAVEKDLQSSEERFRSIFESSPLGILLLDEQGRILHSNPAFQKMTGYALEELKEREISSLMPPLEAGLVVRLIEKLVNCQAVNPTLERRLVRKDGEIVWVKATFAGVNDQSRDCINNIVAMVEDITERKNTESELVEMKARIQANVEAERLHLAQELHDGAMQDLHSVIFQIEGLRQNNTREVKAVLAEVSETVHGTLQELRSIAKELRPPTLARFGLEKAIRSYTGDFIEKYPQIEVHLSLATDSQLLPEHERLVLFRIFQQSMMNVIRHAQASRIDVRFTLDAEEARLEISDNGIGFQVPTRWIALVRKGHYGLAGAAERVEALNGTFQVESAEGSGTCVRVSIPRTEGT